MRRLVLLFVAASLLVVGIGAGAAYAYFTSTGSGSGSATTGNMQTVTLVAVAGGDTPSSDLQPGGTADVMLRVDNPNAFNVTLVSVTGDGTITNNQTGSGCTGTGGVTFTNQTGLSDTIAPTGAGSTLVHLPGAASMADNSPSACQGAKFSMPVTITVHTP